MTADVYVYLIVRKWTVEPKRPGRPGIMGGDRVAYPAHGHGESGVGLHAHPGGAEEPGPRRGPEYGRQGAKANVSRPPRTARRPGGRSCGLTGVRSLGADFFTTEVWTPRGLVT